MVVDIVNWLLDQIAAGIGFVLNLLPDSPFLGLGLDKTGYSTVIGWVNYFVPVAEMVAVLASVLGILLAYYAIQVVMRWVKVIGD